MTPFTKIVVGVAAGIALFIVGLIVLSVLAGIVGSAIGMLANWFRARPRGAQATAKQTEQGYLNELREEREP